MKQKNTWEQFEKTGSINDYLKFVACTKEEVQANRSEEGGQIGSTINSNRNSINFYGRWRLR